MFRSEDLLEAGFLSILFAEGEEPLAFWDKQVRSGRIKRVREETEKEKFQCIELSGINVNSTFITTPPQGICCLGICLPVLVLIVKNLRKYFFYQVQVEDDKQVRRRFRLTNIPGFHRRQPTVCTFPLLLEDGWNELSINLCDLCSRTYGTQYVETVRITIHANCRLREVFFCDKYDGMKTRLSRPTDNVNITYLTPGSIGRRDSMYEDRNNNVDSDDSENPVTVVSKYDKLEKGNSHRSFRNSNSNDDSGSSHGSSASSRKAREEISQEGGSRGNRTTLQMSTYGKRRNLGDKLKQEMYFERQSSPTRSTSSSRRRINQKRQDPSKTGT